MRSAQSGSPCEITIRSATAHPPCHPAPPELNSIQLIRQGQGQPNPIQPSPKQGQGQGRPQPCPAPRLRLMSRSRSLNVTDPPTIVLRRPWHADEHVRPCHDSACESPRDSSNSVQKSSQVDRASMPEKVAREGRDKESTPPRPRRFLLRLTPASADKGCLSCA